ncbi:Acyltransferase family protein [Tritrichomonas foetus]|uniref:Acyltransferase family protein n=1 Tax=Tritrichomonas foetus TaxID=1144522 RepID=A0A1J4K1F8_9EUKA|nr:Acyltransferase family protein [Tritrichomonas foetus]|eukprot:OHT04794.1 Acyltransferase family protein [Tritrichomonas foetus]
MPLYTSVPIDDPKLHNQTELTRVSEEELRYYITPYPCSLPLKILRVICFFVFLGPIKMIFTFLFLFLYYVTVSFLGTLSPLFHNKREFKTWAGKLTYFSVRACLFSLGIVHISVNGEIHPETRTVVVNHLTMVDPISVLSQAPVSYLVMSSLKGISFFEHTSKIFDIIYVDRSKKEGITAQIQNFQNDPSYLPITIFPEGKITNGECVLGFRSGAFINDTPIQPITLRYKHYLCPRNMASIAWCQDDALEYIFQLFTIPFMTLEVTILDKLDWKGTDVEPAERAKQAELAMANQLGCLALANTNKEIFMKNKKED